VPPVPRRVVAALLASAALGLSAAASAQTSTIPEDGAGVTTTPPVPLAGGEAAGTAPSELPNTGADPRMLFLAGLALTLTGFGLRLRTVDADDY
jgi:LPXTG-motif cell wall-anchored protein